MSDNQQYLKYMLESVVETTKLMDQFSNHTDKQQIYALWNNLSVALDEFLEMYVEIEDKDKRTQFLDRLMESTSGELSIDTDQSAIKFPTNKEKAEA